MSVVQPIKIKDDEDKPMNPNHSLEIIFFILNKILDYTNDLEEKTPSKFDHYHHSQSQENNKSSLSTSTSSSDNFSSGPDFCCELDKYDFEDYIIHCYRNLSFSSDLLILSMMILDKLLSKNFILTPVNIHKIFFLCMMETQKYYSDENYKNKDYAKIGGMTADELLELELEFMNYMDFNIFIKDEDYKKYKKNLKKLYKQNIIISNIYVQNKGEEENDDDKNEDECYIGF